MNYTTIYVALILITLMIINSLLAPVVIKEYFVNNDEDMPFITLNKYDGIKGDVNNEFGICGRSLRFPYLKSNYLASQRAQFDSSISSVPNGNCRYDNIPSDINDSYSIIYENGLFYTLKKACIRCNIINVNIIDPTSLNITFAFQEGQDITNIALLYLLNPLWIEFIPSANRTTLAYTIYHDSSVSNVNSNNITVNFKCLLPFDKGDTDTLFNYKQISPTQTELSQDDAISCNKNGYINMKVYYLDDMSASFQTTGRYIQPVIDNSGTYVMFNPQFDSILNKNNQSQIYQFMNNISLMYKNFTVPIFTFNIDILLSIDQPKTFAACSMNNSVGSYSICEIPNNVEQKVNNIFMATIEPSQNSVNIKVFTGDNNQNCGYSEQTVISQTGTPSLMINIPTLSIGTRVKLVFTISPYNRILYAEWKDVMNGDTNKHFAYVQNESCLIGTQNNALYKLFCDRTVNVRQPLSKISLNYNTDIVKNINEITLGYKNLYSTYKV
jgi:hypothetical protein